MADNLYFNYKDELYHFGVLGMRWGVRHYQPYSTVPRESGKRGKEVGQAKKRGLGQMIKDHRTKKKRKKALEKAREIRKQKKLEADEIKKRVNEAIAKGDSSAIKELMPYMSTEEFNNARERVRFADEMQRSKDAKFNETFNKVLKVSTTVGSIADTSSKIYNAVKPFLKKKDTEKVDAVTKSAEKIAKGMAAISGASDVVKEVTSDPKAEKKAAKEAKKEAKEAKRAEKEAKAEEARRVNQEQHEAWKAKNEAEKAEAHYEKVIRDTMKAAEKSTTKAMNRADSNRNSQYKDLARAWESEERKKSEKEDYINSLNSYPDPSTLNEYPMPSSYNSSSTKALPNYGDTSAYNPYTKKVSEISIPPSSTAMISKIVKELPSTPVYLLEKKDY